MSFAQLNRTFYLLFLFFLVLLPFEMPIAQGVHGVFNRVVGSAYPVFFISSLLLELSLFLLLTASNSVVTKGTYNYLFLSTIYVFIGIFALLVTTLQSGHIDLSVKQLFIGYISPVVVFLYVLTLDVQRQRAAWFSLYFGWVLYLLVSIILLIYYWQVGSAQSVILANLSFGKKLFFWRYTLSAEWNGYAQFIGNANKTSNYIIIFMLLSERLLGVEQIQKSKKTKYVFFLFWSCSIITIIVLFSRAALLLLPFVIYFSGITKYISKKVIFSGCSVILTSIVVAYSEYKDVFNYLLFSKTNSEAESNALGTLVSRFDQWDNIYNYFIDKSQLLLFGIGTGQYGENFHNEVNVGTHNMFIDILMEGGIVNLLMLILLLLVMLALSINIIDFKVRDTLSIVSIFSLILLMLREHSVSYLYATSLGGFCFTLLFYLICNSAEDSGRDAFNACAVSKD